MMLPVPLATCPDAVRQHNLEKTHRRHSMLLTTLGRSQPPRFDANFRKKIFSHPVEIALG
ncbi:hypothetical protein LPU83_1297 [Rhizobium favelukesii]|uniref:Uncharacterized protein n=1 Tax=Rhizobium favelukesii TaxID=348824 RepID=W6RRG4_9HYPH|nr:hypothetical protein LPU83_1297 [Rhizobium favelukesii]